LIEPNCCRGFPGSPRNFECMDVPKDEESKYDRSKSESVYQSQAGGSCGRSAIVKILQKKKQTGLMSDGAQFGRPRVSRWRQDRTVGQLCGRSRACATSLSVGPQPCFAGGRVRSKRRHGARETIDDRLTEAQRDVVRGGGASAGHVKCGMRCCAAMQN
jgi:hypothetical protein